jgi:hypothetical protein
LQAGESGVPDLLEKVGGNSKFGGYFYGKITDVIDTRAFHIINLPSVR